MTTTLDYLKVSGQIAGATRARALHDLNVEIGHFGFSPAEIAALREKVSARFGQLNQLAVMGSTESRPTGRFTLAPRTNASLLHRLGK